MLSDIMMFCYVLCVYEFDMDGGGNCWDEGSSVETGLYMVHGGE